MTDWRRTGPVPYALWRDTILAAGGPADLAAPGCRAAAGDLSGLCLAMLGEESSYGTAFNLNRPENRNPLNLRPRGGKPGYLRFATFEDGIAEWRDRLLDPAYAYAPTRTLEELIRVYAPSSDSNNEAAYVAGIRARFARWGVKETPVPDAKGLTPYPPFQDRPLPDKFGAGMTYQYRPPFVATWWHTMVGWLWSTDAYFRLWSTRAATDWGVGGSGDGASDGVVFRWIDPSGRPYATPWASGWDAAPDYDDQGRAFMQQFGARGVNPGGISIEFSGLVATPMTAKQWESGIWLTAAEHHNRIGQGWEEFAWNMQHYEVAEKACPFDRIVKHTEQYQRGVVLTMKHFETGADIPEFIEVAGLRVPLAGGRGAGPVTPPKPPIFQAFAKPIRFTARKGADVRQWANRDAKLVREFKEATVVRCVGYYHGEEWRNDDRWLVVKSPGPSNNGRIHASQVREAIPDALDANAAARAA